MKGFFSQTPLVTHGEGVYERMRLLDVNPVTHALHVGLSGKHPDVADEYFRD